jgi:hypothetical protein
VTTAKQWSAEAIEAALGAQGIALAPGRGERLARGQQALLDADPSTFLLALARCKAK